MDCTAVLPDGPQEPPGGGEVNREAAGRCLASCMTGAALHLPGGRLLGSDVPVPVSSFCRHLGFGKQLCVKHVVSQSWDRAYTSKSHRALKCSCQMHFASRLPKIPLYVRGKMGTGFCKLCGKLRHFGDRRGLEGAADGQHLGLDALAVSGLPSGGMQGW